jgi:hypothetical protein
VSSRGPRNGLRGPAPARSPSLQSVRWRRISWRYRAGSTAVLEAAVDAVHRGLLPGWRVSDDRIRIEMLTGLDRCCFPPSGLL